MQKNIKRIVLTGGPCSGKTTAIDIIIKKLEDKGWKVFIGEEIPTRLFTSGVEISEKGLSFVQFQKQVIPHQIHEEDFLYTMAQQHEHENIVLIFDRGIMDGMAYIGQEDFINILNEFNHNITSARDKRYDAIFHLVTAAIGAEDFYTLKNNKVRKESIPEAIALDTATKNAWIGHPYMRVIDNSGSFEEKMDRLVTEIFSFLEIPISK